jgi:L-seryl-tRNA(Ser) seleniumtransferase
MMDLLRQIPQVDQVLRDAAWKELAEYPEEIAKASLREVLNGLREAIREGRAKAVPAVSVIVEETRRRTARAVTPGLRKVINGTGIVIHTNLGRSPLPQAAIDRLIAIASGYSNLEYDLEKGTRGDRYDHCLSLLKRITRAEAALIVNNNAAAVLLTLNTLAEGREVIISRGELIEIGGSFRIPDVMAKSGALLREVGTTNRTFIEDYEKAVNERTGLLMKAHTSNYRIKGFVHEADSTELAALAARLHLPFYYDIGSGFFSSLEAIRGLTEPSVLEETAKKIDVISFSGDKLLGGPQAGIILGKHECITGLKKNALTRALRPDKFTLSALEATLQLYLDAETARQEVPILRMLNETGETLKKRAARVVRMLRRSVPSIDAEVSKVLSEAGGGSMPDVFLPSYGLSISPSGMSVDRFEDSMRMLEVPIIGRIEKERFLIDMRTIREEEERQLVSGIETVLRDGR